MSNIKKIDTKTTFSVRKPVLRPHQPLESCHFEGDNLPSTTHFGFYDDENMVGIVSTFEKINENWKIKCQMQVRGMAILENFQKKGIGEQLMNEVINLANEKKVEVIWFNARKNAVPFYEKLGFHIKGTAFEIETVGTHYLMYRFI